MGGGEGTGCEGEKERCGWGLGKEWGVGEQRREGHEGGERGEVEKRGEWWSVMRLSNEIHSLCASARWRGDGWGGGDVEYVLRVEEIWD